MSSPDQIVLENGVLRAAFRIDKQGVVALDEISSGPQHQQRKRSKQFESSSVPVAQARFDYQGNRQDLGKTGKALIGSATGPAFQYKSHDIERKGNSQTLHITLHDDSSKITSISHWTLFDDLPVLRSSTTIQNDSSETRTLTEVDSLAIGGLAYGGSDWWNEYDLSIANNTWFREAQWKDMSLPDVGICDYGLFGIGEKVGSMSHFGLSNRSSFSTQGHLPMGMLKRKDQAETWLWQIENNGSWRWEVGDYKDSVYLAATGPEAADHEWSIQLEPGSHYDTCHTALVHIPGNQDAAFAALTQYRRQIIRPHEDYQHLPIIFNDYMNCLMGDPTEQKILDLVDHVAASGAEYFVIDAGWYAENSNWWDDVGAWEPSKWRFPRGFKWLLDEIAHKGLKPGVWVEPEVIGIRCKDVDLPMEAYFQRGGVRATERGRYQLDWRHPAVPKRMDGVIDRLVRGYGVKYFKFDYNIEIVHGTDVGGVSPGAGQEGHQRAYLAWIGRLLDRYPGLVIENCSSGAQRMDYGMLEVHTLQSTSDQQDPVLYAPISAALPTAVLPEQGATWAYPQKDWSDEVNALTVVNALLGRIHLSGRLDQMSAKQRELIYDGMRVYQGMREKLLVSTPFWPLGLPAWQDEWLALGMTTGSECFVSVWRRGGPRTFKLPIAPLKGKRVTAEVLYPKSLEAQVSWDEASSRLEVTLPETACARLCRLVASN